MTRLVTLIRLRDSPSRVITLVTHDALATATNREMDESRKGGADCAGRTDSEFPQKQWAFLPAPTHFVSYLAPAR